jgi:AraC family transcriptional regulator
MKPRIVLLHQKKLVGKRMKMSLIENQTANLWRSFMPHRKEIKNTVTSDLYSLQIFDPDFNFQHFNPESVFEKWAAVEVSNFNDLPDEMETLILQGGLYAVFLHVGAASTGPATFRKIFGSWLPSSPYLIDNRPHFEILGAKYKNDDPASEEEIWIPIKPRLK